ncbi:MAG: CHAT domain-containing protein [Prochloraceae cyanobacterium]|nr:CHAT domain-containing protein [Prochloraceae cyanobacterium]
MTAKCVGKIGFWFMVDREKEIDKQIELLRTSKNVLTLWEAVKSLGKIGTGNPKAIEALINILSTSKDDYLFFEAVKSLGKIGTGNPKAIEALINILSTSKDDYILRQAAESLGKIGTGNPKAIEALINILSTSKALDIHTKAAKDILEKIGVGNKQAIEALKELRHTTNSIFTSWLAEETLKKIDPSANKKAPKVEENLQLFLEVTRVKETVDRYFALNHKEKAKFCYHRIIACLENMQADRDIYTRRSLMKDYVEIYQRIVSYHLQKKDYCRAFFYVEVLRNRYLIDRISQQNKPLPETISAKLKKQIKETQRKEKTALQEYTNEIAINLEEKQLEQLADRWDETKKELEILYTEVAKIEPEFIAKTKINPISFQEIRDLLPAHTAILEFFFTKKELVMMLILPKAEKPIVPESLTIKLHSKALENLAQDWIKDITDKKSTSEKQDNIEATIKAVSERIDRLSKLLKLNNLLAHIPPDIEHLIVVPHNYLHLFPLHALWINERERLIDRFAVSYVPNLQVWKICQQRQRDRTSLVCIENPSQDKDLIFAKAEVAAIVQRPQFRQNHRVVKDKQTSPTDILEIAKSARCFHFSGHAEYNLKNPLESYLMLSNEEDKNLTLNKIFAELEMPKTDLVSLSACCTAVVDAFQPAEEHIGLSTGFLLAGAKAAIGSLWKVNSIATAFLFDEFYRQLEKSDNKAIALQKAQNWLRRSTDEQLRERSKEWDLSKLQPKEEFRLKRALKKLKRIPRDNPYYWTAFILTGV